MSCAELAWHSAQAVERGIILIGTANATYADSGVVAALRLAGAVILGKCETVEFAGLGGRVALWRPFELFDDLGIRATTSMNAAVFEHFPRIAEEMVRRDGDYQSHGLYNTRSAFGMDEPMKRELIETVIDIVRRATGKTISGWLETAPTTALRAPDLLAEAGARYWADMFHDDEPTEVRVAKSRLLTLPYSFEVNSGVALGGQAQTAQAFGRLIKDQFDMLYEEGAAAPKLMAICLHTFAVTAPSRIKYLRQVLEYILGHAMIS